ncbi:hypothetical protein [Corynebacterium gallinarum]|uniref:Uncharacterized protein n=1 Tax=Corynebacterium gallinarum TaxID=2762214 RepID=A0A8I0HRK1_9CORY|nr:hypothetical protein [Corynebacterium gallinarum]MBD8031418.1 hypothetical protein [Corynebacterium gallinarum]
MTIPARTKHPGTWWHDTEITTTTARDGNRKKIRLTIGGNLKVDLSRAQAVELINAMADVLEGGDDG